MILDDLRNLQEQVIKEQKPSSTPRIITTIIHNDLTENIKYDPLPYEKALLNGHEPGDYYYISCIRENSKKSLLENVFSKGLDEFEGLQGRTPYKNSFTKEDVMNNINNLKPLRETYVIADKDFEKEANNILNNRSLDYKTVIR